MARRAETQRPRRRRPGKHLKATTQGMRFVNKATFVVLVGTCCLAVAVLAVPQSRDLRGLEEQLVRVEAKEQHTIERKEQKARELDAVKNDPAYLEMIARDRLDLYLEGEKILRIER